MSGTLSYDLRSRVVAAISSGLSPDFNPIELAFSKLKSHLRKAAERTFDGMEKAIATALKTFHPQECAKFFNAAGYEPI